MKDSRFLIIEDNPGDIRLMQIAIQRAQIPVELEVHGRGEEALKDLKDRSEANFPDLIILDINLPGMTGFEILKEIKSDSRLSRIPAFIMSSSENVKDRERAVSGGALNYFSKPNTMQDLQNLMISFVESTQMKESSQ